ncbi:MAG: CHASE domain-containing protein [Bdellovibrionota bacterium]
MTLHNLLVIGSFLFALLTFALLQKYANQKNLSKIEFRGKTVQSLLEKSFNENLEIVYSIQNLFYTRKDFSRAEFKNFVSSSLLRHPGLQAVEHMIYLKDVNRKRYEQKMRAEGFANFTIKELDPGAGVQIAAKRPDYYVINYAEPLQENLAALGYDVSFTPPAKEALLSAQKNGMGVSPWMPLAQGEVGFVVYMSIQRSDGYAVGVFRLNKFVETAIKAEQADSVDFIIEEVIELPNPKKVFKYDSQAGQLVDFKDSTNINQDLISTTSVKFGQRTWRLVHFPSANYRSIIHPVLPYAAALTVLLLMLALTFFFYERDARVTAQTATKVREEFMTVASHELRTPLTPLKMEIFLIKELVQSGKVGKEKITQLLENANKHLNHIVALIDDLLDVGRIGEEHYQYEFSHFKIDELIRNTAEKFDPIFKANNCSLIFSVQPDVKVFWDAQRIEQVLTNCFSNAVKFSPKAVIEIKLRSESQNIIFSIKDNGIGISTDFQKKIFNKFERGVSSRGYGGLGIGLFIVHEIIKAHGGRVKIESSLGQGAEFIFQVPSHV